LINIIELCFIVIFLEKTMADLEQLVRDMDRITKEFEKLHDAIPTVRERVSKMEEWQRSHPDIHRLEKEGVATAFTAANIALSTAKEEIERRLLAGNKLREQIESERGTFVGREMYDREHDTLNQEIIDVRNQFIEERNLYVTREMHDKEHAQIHVDISDLRKSRDTGSGERTILEKLWPFIMAGLTGIIGHFWH
jgi:chromosome segregation ATPase